jgi:4-hydroxymandelate oxidase
VSADLDLLEREAYHRLPGGVREYVAAGAGDEEPVREAVAAWRRIALRPRALRGVGEVDCRCSVLGAALAIPIVVAPTGRHLLVHPEGEHGTVRGAGAAGTGAAISAYATVDLAELAARAGDVPLWFQIPLLGDPGVAAELAARAAAAGYRALMLTADLPLPGWSPRIARTPMRVPERIRLQNLPGRPPALSAYDVPYALLEPVSQSLADIERVRAASGLPVIVKGVLRGDDARACVDAGAAAIVVSNHGGRHIDHVLATADALPEVVDAVGGGVEVYLDGGIRDGVDVLKALALGARAVMVGRPPLWGLATGGGEGVAAVLRRLGDELRRAMALCGARDLGELDRDLLVLRDA